jgi:Lon protease-like protein
VSALLPLFPLELVLFPDVPLPLHVFEPRYKEMISECLAQKSRFGIVRAQENTLAEIGCTAEIVAVTKKYDDGRMDIVTEGRQRFEVLEVSQDRSFLQAHVMFFQDEGEAAAPEEVARAVKLQADILALAGARQDLPSSAGSHLSFHLVAPLPLDLDFKQNLLAMRSEAKRIQAINTYLDAILPKLRRAVHVRQKAGGNGHAQ